MKALAKAMRHCSHAMFKAQVQAPQKQCQGMQSEGYSRIHNNLVSALLFLCQRPLHLHQESSSLHLPGYMCLYHGGEGCWCMFAGLSAQLSSNVPDPGNTDEWGIYNFKATIAYKGTRYKGWQIQNGPQSQETIQQAFERAVYKVKGENRRVMRVQGAGRTDAGVHARGQVHPMQSSPLSRSKQCTEARPEHFGWAVLL